MGNPFLDDFPELLKLDNRDCASNDVINTVRTIKKIGKEKYDAYVKNVVVNRSVQIQQPIKKNKLPLFKMPSQKTNTQLKQHVADLKADRNLFSRCKLRANSVKETWMNFSHMRIIHGLHHFRSKVNFVCRQRSQIFLL